MDTTKISNISIQSFWRRALQLRSRYLDNFLFIHINKTGGSSIEKALNLPLEHKTAEEKILQIGQDQWDQKYTFTVVRNPWDRVVSHYHYRFQRDVSGIQTDGISFNDWVRLTYRDQDPIYYNKPKMFQPQLKWVADDSGQILVDFICRFESLESDFQQVCKSINQRKTLPHLKSSQRRNYHEYFNLETIMIIEKWFQIDIDMFKYTY